MPEAQLSARRITGSLLAAQSVGSAGQVAAFTVMAIAGAQLSGHEAWAGLPGTILLLGTAAASLAWGYLMDRWGRRRGLAAGFLVGALGTALAAWAIVAGTFLPFLVGLVLLGTGRASLQLSRFVAAEVHQPDQRGRAISRVVIGGTAGAILGPLLIGPSGRLAELAGLDPLTGPYAVGVPLFVLGAVVLVWGLRPEPRDLARLIGSPTPAAALAGRVRTLAELLREPGVLVAMAAMIFGQLTMTLLMVITALHMKAHDHSLDAISTVYAIHVLGMYAFSILTGRLADSRGRIPVIIAGSLLLILACLMAPLSAAWAPLGLALFLLGVGWNFTFVGGSSLLSDQLSPEERSRTQGFNDLMVSLAAAVGSLGSGVVYAGPGFGAMAVVGMVTAAIPLASAVWWRLARPEISPAPAGGSS